MLHSLGHLFAPAAMERLTLLANHVIGREPAATERLKQHIGAALSVGPQAWPAWLPRPSPAVFRVTPAGLLEWVGQTEAPTPDLKIEFDASNPAAVAMGMLAHGRLPAVSVEGDARFATDVDWLVANLRWDIADDLERQFGTFPAQVLTQLGRALARGIELAARGAEDLKARRRPSA